MGFIIDIKGYTSKECKVFFDDMDLSSRIRKVEIVAAPGELTTAILTVNIDKLNGIDIMGA